MTQIVTSPEAMEAAGAALVKNLVAPAVIYLRGDLGAGKTTLVRGALRQLGHSGLVKSPTFTLVESYSLSGIDIYHLDLYRISDPEELEYIGIREFSSGATLCFIEWPDLGVPLIPNANIEVKIEYVTGGRRLIVKDNKL